ncbi:MAG: hypothetical protein IVW57_08020 [Ktedonobacterales bacterium]|nr:hypothetical protein [Ktedonobacterales bacterium]
MTIRLSVAIMHDPRRSANLRGMLNRLDCHLPLTVVIDGSQAGVWATAKRGWLACAPEATHHLVLQDDIWPCAGFLDAAHAALAACAGEIVSFYANRAVIQHARLAGSAWTRVGDFRNSQAVAMPVWLIDEFLEWEAAHVTPDRNLVDDMRLAMFAIARRRYVWCTAPSLVEHVGYASSLIGHPATTRGMPRQARWYIEDGDARLLDWTRGVNHPNTEARLGSLSGYRDYLVEATDV